MPDTTHATKRAAMANFMDLPKDVREEIYRLHLLRESPITDSEHRRIVNYDSERFPRVRCMPPIFAVSSKVEKEAAPIYYGENEFDLGTVYMFDTHDAFLKISFRRHLKFVRTITCTWASTGTTGYYTSRPTYGGYGSVGENFRRLSKLPGLKELKIRVDEAEIIKALPTNRGHLQHTRGKAKKDLTHQQGLAIFRFPGVTGLLSLSGKNVSFIELQNDKGEKSGGLVPGGPLETYILPQLRASVQQKRSIKKRPFRFLDLPPELRNRIYDLILRITGPIHLSKEPPTTAPKGKAASKSNEFSHCESALSLLLVNKQIRDEAVGLFYNANSFSFAYPTQFQAFLLSIGDQRKGLLRDLTMDYYNLKCGGIELIELALPLLKQLKGLRRLHIVMKARLCDTTLRRGWLTIPWHRHNVVNIHSANPNMIPGIKQLFELRGITDIKIRDVELEEKVEELEKEPGYPAFANSSRNKDIMQLSRAYEHFNLALAAAQQGNVNQEILQNTEWHMRDTFPALGDEVADDEDGEEEDVSQAEGGEGDDEDEEMDDGDSDFDFGW